MKIASLGSGSKGNATLVSNGETSLLIDCGFSLKKIEQKAQALGFDLSTLNAILVTHEHSDHITGVSKLATRYKIPIYLTLGSACKLEDKLDKTLICPIYGGQSIKIGSLSVRAVTVPHDCLEPVQFVFKCLLTSKSLGVLTDIGHISSHVSQAYSNLDALLLEFNYDPSMLQNGPYPYSLKQRVSSDYGHLSNDQSMSLLKAIATDGMKTLIVGHISEKNNHPDLIEELLKNEKQLPQPLLATQTEGFAWVSI